jgi:hypothetical protein
MAYVMRVDDRARVTHAAATPAERKVPGARQHLMTIAEDVEAFLFFVTRGLT